MPIAGKICGFARNAASSRWSTCSSIPRSSHCSGITGIACLPVPASLEVLRGAWTSTFNTSDPERSPTSGPNVMLVGLLLPFSPGGLIRPRIAPFPSKNNLTNTHLVKCRKKASESAAWQVASGRHQSKDVNPRNPSSSISVFLSVSVFQSANFSKSVKSKTVLNNVPLRHITTPKPACSAGSHHPLWDLNFEF